MCMFSEWVVKSARRIVVERPFFPLVTNWTLNLRGQKGRLSPFLLILNPWMRAENSSQT